jgi:hypothetical protein
MRIRIKFTPLIEIAKIELSKNGNIPFGNKEKFVKPK